MSDFWDGLLALDPEFFQIYLNFSAKPWKSGTLDPKIKEFMYIAIDVATTHLYEPGLRIHLQNAFKYGATKEEILEVYQLVSVLGMHTITMGVPVLIEEMDAAGLGDEDLQAGRARGRCLQRPGGLMRQGCRGSPWRSGS